MLGRLLAIALILYPALALAQFSPLPGFPPGVFQNRAAIDAPSVGFQGAGDIVTGAKVWIGLRAYNASYAASLGKSVNACNPGDGACADLNVNSSGSLVVGTIGGEACSQSISAGTYVSATGALALTTALGANLSSGNPFSLSGLTGTGTLTGLQVELTATTGTTGTTVNATAATGLGTITITGGTISVCTIKTFYDQSGALNCSGSIACNPTQATIASRAILTIGCINALPCATFNGTSATYSSASFTSMAQPNSVSMVAEQIGNTASTNVIFASANLFEFRSGAVVGYFAGTSTVTAAQTISHFHSVQFVGNGSSSSINVDGTITGSLNPGSTALGTTAIAIGSNSGSSFFAGNWLEQGAWPTGFTSPNQSAMVSNQTAYWGPF